MESTVTRWLATHDTVFYQQRTRKLVPRYDEYLNRGRPMWKSSGIAVESNLGHCKCCKWTNQNMCILNLFYEQPSYQCLGPRTHTALPSSVESEFKDCVWVWARQSEFHTRAHCRVSTTNCRAFDTNVTQRWKAVDLAEATTLVPCFSPYPRATTTFFPWTSDSIDCL
jgi:hypothetical protein